MPYFVYIALCADGTYYTGVTTDLERRLAEHNGSTKGARYTKTRQPVIVAYSEEADDRSSAQSREYAVRTLTHRQKADLINASPYSSRRSGDTNNTTTADLRRDRRPK